VKRRLFVNLTPGLGNQMFQYAAGLYLAKQWGASLKMLLPANKYLNPGGFSRIAQLDRFNVAEAIHPATLWRRWIQSAHIPEPIESLRQVAAASQRVVTIHEQAQYSADLPSEWPQQARDVYLRGYFQAYAFAAAVDHPLRQSLVSKAPLSSRSQRYLEAIRSETATVSLHVRAGDYATFVSGTKDHARSLVLRPQYYLKALQRLEKLGIKARPVLFSDDHAFASRMLSLHNPIVVSGNADHPEEDLQLMSSCTHHIIANSTFSWWGAWLNRSSKKKIFAPKFWNNQPDSHFPALCPPSWELIDNLAEERA